MLSTFVLSQVINIIQQLHFNYFVRTCGASKTTMAGMFHHVWKTYTIILLYALITRTESVSYIDAESPDQCKKSSSDAVHEFYDISQLRCQKCDQDSTFQTVSADGLRCVCRKGYKLIRDFGGRKIECEKCGVGEVTSSDGWECIDCKTQTVVQNANVCLSCNVAAGFITVERDLTGRYAVNPGRARQCKSCSTSTMPDATGTRCVRCNQLLAMAKGAAGNATSSDTCTCDSRQLTGGMCFPTSTDIEPDDSTLYEVTFKTETFESAYFYEHIRAAHGMCQPKYGNLTACQLLGNLCTLLLYKAASSRDNSACKLYQSFTKLGRRRTEWPVDMPWLYYEDDMGDKILEEINVRETYSFPKSRLNLVLITYALNGSYLGVQPVTGSSLQLCPASESVLDAALLFGTTYKKSCKISVRSFWDEVRYKPVFYDMYLQFEYQQKRKLYAIPLLIRNFNSHADMEQRQNWKLVRRFFMIDNISGREITKLTGGSGQPQTKVAGKARAVRYIEKIVLNIELRDTTGQIYPPFLDITYNSANTNDYDADRKVQVSFEVTYRMNIQKYKRDKAISAGVLSAFAVIYTILQTWGWSKRAGKIAIDFITIIKFLVLFCGAVANMFFLTIFGTSLWWLIFFKKQDTVMLMLPTAEQEKEFLSYLISAFVLKAVHVFHLIVTQVTVDIFLLDWERPHGRAAQATDTKIDMMPRSPVSIWRTCFIANEWNEIQTVRKVNTVIQIFSVVFFLYVVGFENIASRDPHSKMALSNEEYNAESSRVLRFAIASCVYLSIALVQWLFYTLVYQRFIEDPVRQFVDLCSVTNTSVFILENALYGYYIHGRSVHGCADTGMHEMLENLKREEEDLCGQRGLLPGTEQQTFQVAIPRMLRAQYDRILLPMSAPQHGAVAHATPVGNNPGHLNLVTEKSVQAYTTLNRFLQAFVDHSLHDIDYVVQDRMFIESILNVEFRDSSEKGMFITDNGHSFDNVLFFGNERTLLIFDVLLFCIIDVIVHNFILAAILTFFVSFVTSMVRNSLGQANLAKKTLVDRRFLI